MIGVALILVGSSLYFLIITGNNAFLAPAGLGLLLFGFFMSSWYHDRKLHKFTCYECGLRLTCQYAWDLYNTNGDCLAEK